MQNNRFVNDFEEIRKSICGFCKNRDCGKDKKLAQKTCKCAGFTDNRFGGRR